MQAYIYDMLKQQNLVLRYKWNWFMYQLHLAVQQNKGSAVEVCDIHFKQYHANVKKV